MKRVLIVDDNPRNLALAGVILELEYEVIEADNGPLALELAKTGKPDLVLMDLSMPQMDGWEALAELRKMPETAALPVIAVTAHALVGDRERALAAGFNAYVTKPIDDRELLAVIKQHIGE